MTKFPSLSSGSLLPVHRILLCLDDHFSIRPISFNLEIRLINARNSQSNELVYRQMDGYFKRGTFSVSEFSSSLFFFLFCFFLELSFFLKKRKKYRFHLNFDLRSQENQLIYKFSRVSPFVHRYFRSRDQDQYLQLISSSKFFLFLFFFSFFKKRQVELTLDMLIFFLTHISD